MEPSVPEFGAAPPEASKMSAMSPGGTKGDAFSGGEPSAQLPVGEIVEAGHPEAVAADPGNNPVAES